MDFNREFGEKDNTVISNIQGNIQSLSQQGQNEFLLQSFKKSRVKITLKIHVILDAKLVIVLFSNLSTIFKDRKSFKSWILEI